MVENPLLPNAELRALYALLKRAAKADAPAARTTAGEKLSHSASSGGREALLAGTLLQLRAGDCLLPEAEDSTPGDLLRARIPEASLITAPCLPPGAPQLMLAAGIAAALPTTDPRPLVLVLLRSGHDEPYWERALTWAQDQRLPLIVACADPSGAGALRGKPKAKREAMEWTALARFTTRLKLPVLTVDGEDAVAVYRVMQESVLRARSGDGPAVLWAVLPTLRERAAGGAPQATPSSRLRRYLRTRNIAL